MHRPSAQAFARKLPKAPVLRGCALDLGSAAVPLHSGAVHYWRMERSHWRRALESARSLGLGIVETYVPWGVHEINGAFDFGQTKDNLDLGAFLELASELDLAVIVRPGPHINAELTYFGLPERIVNHPECQARSPRGNPVIQPFPPCMFPAPSYASERFLEETGKWFDAVAEVVKPHIWPRGAVVMTQVDNESTFYFRNGPYDQDYHPDAIALYHAFLRETYGDIGALNVAYDSAFASFADVQAPTHFDARSLEDLPPHLDWAEFHEHLLARALTRMRARMEDAGLGGVPVIHNFAMGESGLPMTLPGAAKAAELVGLDYYHPAREHRTVKRRTSLLAGTFEFAYSPELGVGAPPWFTPLSHHDSLTTAMTAAAYGLRGFNLYMLVDRDRWYGAPIDNNGTPRTEAAAWKRWIAALQRTEFHRLERKAEVAIILPSEYRRLSRATHLFGGVASPSALEAIGGTPVDGCSEETLGLKGPVQILWWKAIARVTDALTRKGIPYVLIDADAAPERFEGFHVVYSPTFEFVSPARWKTLVELRRKGAMVIAGPAVPTLTDHMRPLDATGADSLEFALFDTDWDADEAVGRWLRDARIDAPYRATPGHIETAAHTLGGALRLLFVMNPFREAVDAQVNLGDAAAEGGTVFEDVISGQRFEAARTLTVRMLPLSCRALEVVVAGAHAASKPPEAPSPKRGKRSGR